MLFGIVMYTQPFKSMHSLETTTALEEVRFDRGT